MDILAMRMLEGPNIYSYRPVLKIKLDIGGWSEVPTCDIPGFNSELLKQLPGLAEHYCSRGYYGGFKERLEEGTYLAHVFEHVALELENLAGFKVSFGKARCTEKHTVYDVVIGLRDQEVARQAARSACDLLKHLLQGKKYELNAALKKLVAVAEKNKLGPSTKAIYDAAVKRNIPVSRVGDEDLLILGYGCYQQRIWATVTGHTGVLAADLVSDKNLTKLMLAENGIPVPDGVVVTTAQEAVNAWRQMDKLVAVKPLCGNQGKGVTVKINTAAEVERAFSVAYEFDKHVLVEEYIWGRQYRLCIINGRLVAASERIPAYIVGDGEHTVEELIAAVNRDPLRGDGHGKPLTKIMIDAVAVGVLAKQHINRKDVPAKGQEVYIRYNANLSNGGTAVDVTDKVHPETRLLAERAADIVGLDIAGVDIVAADIARSIYGKNGAVIEINAAPGIRMHQYPTAGKMRDVGGEIVNYLFPAQSNGRIPIIAVTGTNGKTTVTRLIGHICAIAGYKVGMTTTDGIYINGKCVLKGDTTGPASAHIVLHDANIDIAVLETARGGILRKGLAFDQCDIGIITNVTEDHLGQDGIDDLEDLAAVKSLIVETVQPKGFAILNADDPYVVSRANFVRGKIVYFSLKPDNMIVKRHLGTGGRAFFVKDHTLWMAEGKLAQAMCRIENIPITFGGIALHNVQNVIVAAAACYCQQIPLAAIQQGLSSFQTNPGRLTMVDMHDFRICVDYGHNPAGYQALIKTVQKMGAKRLVGVIAAPGDRRDEIIVNLGQIAGAGFDYIYIKEDDDLRGRAPGYVAQLLYQGVVTSGMLPEKVKIVLDEQLAVKKAISEAQAGDLIVVFYEKYDTVMTAIGDSSKKMKANMLRKNKFPIHVGMGGKKIHI